MRILVAQLGTVIKGQEERFKQIVTDKVNELKKLDAWLRDNIDSYKKEVEAAPPDFEAEVVEDLKKYDNIYVSSE
ncbi:MAG: hypothetical protein KGH64_00560 [Candidatus Micrarchaeota archaeon]|nr:hypothetical protein [Candidatus Micrarchaeota archaeon]